MNAYEELELYLKNPNQGIYSVRSHPANKATIGADWQTRRRLIEDTSIDVFSLGVPSDCGAGIVRGAAWGPMGLRQQMGGFLNDIGDVLCVPQYLDDSMLNVKTLEASRRSVYKGFSKKENMQLPVSPLSILERCCRLIFRLRPGAKLLVVGGDHSVSWPLLKVLLERDPEIGILHFDAHTDLLEERLGVRYCFATWAFHALKMLSTPQRFLQVGLRASAHDANYWQERFGLQQIWAESILALSPDQLAAIVVERLEATGVRKLYVSNDIDGTDSHYAAACGTPEPGGLHPDQLIAVLQAVRGRFEVIGSDLVELAPFLSLSKKKAALTCVTAAKYYKEQFALL